MRLELSSLLSGSRYFVVTPAGDVVGTGTFRFSDWDERTRRETLAAIVRSKLHDATVSFRDAA